MGGWAELARVGADWRALGCLQGVARGQRPEMWGIDYNWRASGKAANYDRSVGSLEVAQGLWARMWGQVRKT